MKKVSIFLFVMLVIAFTVKAQKERSPYRRGYLRAGLNTLGKELDNPTSPMKNVLDGRYGAGLGYVLEVGHIFYFRDRNSDYKMNVGLDWTIFSGSYNPLDKWDSYGESSLNDYSVSGDKMSISGSSKIGPVVSWNVVEKLVIDARIQVGYMARVSSLFYGDIVGGTNLRYVSFGADHGSNEELARGIITSFGITVRRKAIGLSFDYIAGKLDTPYRGEELDQPEVTDAKEKISTNGLQLKLSFTF